MSAAARVLVVDDTQLNLVLLSGILQDAGYEVRVANTAARALKALERQPADVVLLDVEMPETDGVALCRTLKSMPAFADMPVVFLSGHDDPAVRARAFGAGGADYIVKPYEAAEVLARVGAQVERAAAREMRRLTLAVLGAQVRGRALGGEWRVGDALPVRAGVQRADAVRVSDGTSAVVHLLLPTPEATRVLGAGAPELVAFRHAAVVPVLAAGVSDGLPWIASAPEGPPASAARVASAAPDLRAGLEAAHAHGLVHGHVDESHVVDDHGHVRLAGLGLAALAATRRIHPADDFHALERLLARGTASQA